jgi:hypothetical protein
MPFDPAKPASNSPLVSAEMREQFNALNDKIDSTLPGPQGPPGPPGEVTNSQLSEAMNQAVYQATVTSSNNTNGVAVLEIQIGNPPTQADVQAIMDKLNELISALRR